MYETVAEEFLHFPVTLLCDISLLTSPKEELQNSQNSKFHCSAMAFRTAKLRYESRIKIWFSPRLRVPAAFWVNFGHHSRVTQTAKSITQHPDPPLSCFRVTFNRKRMKRLGWVRAFQEARVVLLQVFIRTSCDIGIHFINLRI